VIAVCGDGGLMMALGELATLVQEQLPVTVLVVDDGGYGMLRYDQVRAGHAEVGVDLATPDFPAIAAAFGIPARTVTLGDLAGALAPAEGPRLVHLRARLTPPRTTSPRWHED
jgi:acetolactate synthase-1/2/3 large subunit